MKLCVRATYFNVFHMDTVFQENFFSFKWLTSGIVFGNFEALIEE